METEKTTIVKTIVLKGKNKRITIQLRIEDGKGTFFLKTMTLQDFKKRHISETSAVYSTETFFVLANAFSEFTDNSEIRNKLLFNELAKMSKWTGYKDFS